MGWWKRLFGKMPDQPINGTMYRVVTTLFSRDGKRCAEIREFDNGQIYLLESEWVEASTFKNRHEGAMVGPFLSPNEAERFIVATAWFNGEQ